MRIDRNLIKLTICTGAVAATAIYSWFTFVMSPGTMALLVVSLCTVATFMGGLAQHRILKSLFGSKSLQHLLHMRRTGKQYSGNQTR